MNIFIDIGHPGHVHYFRKLIYHFKSQNHSVTVSARNRDVVKDLLNFYKIEYFDRGEGKNSVLGKLFYMFKTDWLFFKRLRKTKPDLFVSFSSPYAAQTAWLFRKPHIAFNDTEHSDKFHKVFTYPFSKTIVTPDTYQNNLGKKQIRFKGIMEDIYLNKNVFSVEKLTGINKPFVILRFISWNAHHDIGQKGLTLEAKRKLISLLEKKYSVLISSEEKLDSEFEKYRLDIAPEKIHYVLAMAKLFVGESGTMASESSYLGVPTVYINSLPLMCYLKLEQECGILRQFKSSKGVLEYVEMLLTELDSNKFKEQSEKMKSRFIKSDQFVTWFIENYPKSLKIMKENPEYQYRFK
ncbi:DUF354 domain-containing protein [Saccharicrinis sp. FJH2]|uniref:DUF354 domain-containing protein n=1 Tax=Saccharicrinis sp. FJH65 TaxID=3344659 RepID=UPI0035F4B9FE